MIDASALGVKDPVVDINNRPVGVEYIELCLRGNAAVHQTWVFIIRKEAGDDNGGMVHQVVSELDGGNLKYAL